MHRVGRILLALLIGANFSGLLLALHHLQVDHDGEHHDESHCQICIGAHAPVVHSDITPPLKPLGLLAWREPPIAHIILRNPCD